jgi:hypothetical protein
MIVSCGRCRRSYDGGDLAPGCVIACECGDAIMVVDTASAEPAGLVRALVERVAREEGLVSVPDADGRRWTLRRDQSAAELSVDSSSGVVAVHSSLVAAPASAEARLALFEELLRLNDRDTGEAKFALRDGVVTVAFVRDVHGLDYVELVKGISAVLRGAEDYEELVRQKAGATAAADEDEIDLDAYVTGR